MTTTRDELRFDAEAHLEYGGGGDELAHGVLALLDQLDAAEHAARLAHDRAYKADLSREDEKRRADQAEARIKAVQDVLDRHDDGARIPAHRIRRALEG